MISNTLKLADLLRNAEAQLSDISGSLARRDAEIMLAHLLDVSVSRLPLMEEVASDVASGFAKFIARRAKGEPVAYITGVQEFWSLEFAVNESTLIPRPDSETLVEAALKHIAGPGAPRIADLGTGSGCILISLLHETPSATGMGLDMSEGALAVAQQNAATCDVQNRSEFLQSYWFDAVREGDTFDLIVSNPPYIEAAVIPNLMPDVKDFEPMSALDGGVDGLDCYRTIVAQAPNRLRADGMLAVEVGKGQAQDVAALFCAAELADIKVHKDLAGVERVVCAKKAQES